MSVRASLLTLLLCMFAVPVLAQGTFVNFETPQVHPVDLSPDGNTLAVCNTADNRVELFALASGTPVLVDSVPVGLDPVSARFRNDNELWVVNQISDSVTVIRVDTREVVRTLETLDEPADVVFATMAAVPPVQAAVDYALVSCSQANTVLVFDANDPNNVPPGIGAELAGISDAARGIAINGEDPRAMVVSPDGRYVYVAIFESGNRSTLLGGGSAGDGVISFPPNVVDDSNTPHGVQNPPFNDGNAFFPPKNPANGTAPRVGLIVKQDDNGVWRDDTNADWTSFISGPNAAQSGRVQGWTLLDHDVAVSDVLSGNVDYIDSMMNICMTLDLNPATGEVTVVGTDAMNEIRFEPNVNSIFNRVNIAFGDAGAKAVNAIVDLNKDHIQNYTQIQIPQNERDKSLGEPRGIVWNAAGTRGWITGRGSNNLIVVDSDGNRAGNTSTIEVGEGPTGLVLDEGRGQLYVLNQFEGSVSVIDTVAQSEVAVVPFYDPTPEAIKVGRKHLYDTHKNSGLGQAACASCHIDARMDRLSWDLGDPSGEVAGLENRNLAGSLPGSEILTPFRPFHPMKGPMSTQTLVGIIGQEPFHWRGDRLGLEEFNPAFIGLQGDDTNLTPGEMQEFEDFLETIYFPPNPYRNRDNSLPTNVDLTGHYTPPPYGSASTPEQLPNGNAQRGLDLYRDQSRRVDQGVAACVTCHTLPSGNGPDSEWNGVFMEPIPPGPMDERHLMLVSIDGSTQSTIKVAQLRNLYDKVGANFMLPESRAGFGFLHDGSVDSIERFIGEGAFNLRDAQEVADLTALMLAFSGSDFGVTNPAGGFREPEGVPSRDVHAAVGMQTSINTGDAFAFDEVDELIDLVDASDRIELVVKARLNGVQRGWLRTGAGLFRSDDINESLATLNDILVTVAAAESAAVFTVVPTGSGARIGVDRDLDGCFDFNERQAGTNPADPEDVPPVCGAEGEGEGEGSEGEGEGEEGEIDDDVPPVIFVNGGTQIVHECGTSYTDAGATANDNVDGNITSAIVQTGSVNITQPGFYTLTYTVSDTAGNTTQVTRTVEVTDGAAPVITLLGASAMTVPCGTAFNDPGAVANDSCDGNTAVVVSGAVDSNAPGSYAITYDATDSSGNASETVTRSVLVTDVQPPVLTLIGASTVTVECGEAFADPGVVAADACEGDLSAVVVVTGGDIDVNQAGVHLITYTVTDGSGNAAPTLTRRVTVRDTVAPVITLAGENPMVIDCGEGFTDPGATAVDACQGNVNVTMDDSSLDPELPGVYEVRYTATDRSGNGTVQLRTVRVAGALCDDTDQDGLPDAWERTHFGNLSPTANGDDDRDGLNNRGEFDAGTQPSNRDSDGDGATDGAEVAAGTDPNDASSVPPKSGLGCGAGSAAPDGGGDGFALVVMLMLLIATRWRTRYPN